MDFQSRSRLAGRLSGLSPSLYARILGKLSQYDGEVYPFHIGETHLLPMPSVLTSLAEASQDRAVHRYGHPQGLLELRELIAQRLNQSGMPEIGAGDVVVTHGATHGLNLACQAILDPGDVMLVLSPHWPLINAMVHTASAVPVEVPFTCQLRDGKSAYDILSDNMMRRVRAVYVTSPNNPDGYVLNREQLADVARFCTEHNLYALVDEAYDMFVYGQRPPRLMGFDGMADKTISVFTFSKSHRMTGLRVGYSVAPPDVRQAMTKLANISIYNVSMLTQRAAIAALRASDEIIAETVRAATTARETMCNALAPIDGIRFTKPEGGAYVFCDLDEKLGDRDCMWLLDRCLDEGVVFAPGAGFGKGYARQARLCFTAMAPEHLERGLACLVNILDET